MAAFYTRSGDDGFTGRLGKGRVPKHHLVIEAIGDVDEASAMLGLARAQTEDQKISNLLLHVQRDLYNLMAAVSATKENAAKFQSIDEERLKWLEAEIDSLSNSVEIPNEFIVPGDSILGAVFAVGRSIVRRAERKVAELFLAGEIENPLLLSYLNRLSSLCFVLELRENQLSEAGLQTLAKPDPD
jgi:cob(I)alamin adenosyltransferase